MRAPSIDLLISGMPVVLQGLDRQLPMKLETGIRSCRDPKLPSKRFLCFFAMSIRNSQDLTQEEQILHHHAAMIKKDLEAYHAYSRTEEDWKELFKNRLARLILIIYFYKPFS